MDETGTEKKIPGRFWQGFLAAMVGWILDTGLASFLASLGVNNGERLSFAIRFFPIIFLLLAFIWLPVAMIAGVRSRRRGLKNSLVLVAIIFIIAPVLFYLGFILLIAVVGF